MDVAFLISFFVVAITLVIVGAVVSAAKEKKRTETLASVAGQLGLTFFPEGNPGLVEELAALDLFSRGRSRKTANLIHGAADETTVAIVDYRYTTGSGKHSHTWRQTVVCFHSQKLALPFFALRPARLFDRLGGLFGKQDINFESHPRFSQTFRLRGQPEEHVRRHFTPAVLEFFEARPDVSVEGNAYRMVYYRAGRRPKPEDVPALFKEAFAAFTLLRQP
jgi:hypothetical protein